MTNIVLAEDHHIVRKGLHALLEAESDFKVVGEASDGIEAVELTERLKPDVLVCDLIMPGQNGQEVTRKVVHDSPQTRVIILSMYDKEAYVLDALKAGARAYVLKGSAADELVKAIREVLAGRRYLSPPLSERAVDAYAQKATAGAMDPYDRLTDREKEILHLAAEGLTNAEIASRLVVSPRTAETHRTNMMRKLALTNRADLVRYAIKRGIVQPDS
ncbi:MAG: response regulator transcription factor [Chloroflexi bacterium]|nr:response regulator transcription factor [Chloroflexota bacterium]